MYVIKRDGKEVIFNESKILSSIYQAAKEIKFILTDENLENIRKTCVEKITALNKEKVPVEKIQDIIETSLYVNGFRAVKNAYSDHRKERTAIREFKSDLMHVIDKIGVETDRDNANVGNNFSSKLLRIASESNKWHNLAKMPKDMAKLHEEGDLYYHDLDSFNLTTNCLHIPTKEVLERGFNTGYGWIRPPKRIESAGELSCILLQSTQNDMFGGQSHPDFDNDMAGFVQGTREEITREIDALCYMEAPEVNAARTEAKVEKAVRQSMQGICYNLNTMHSRAGSQVPFSSINVGIPLTEDAALVCRVFLEEYEKGMGNEEQMIFPNIIFRLKTGVNRNPEDPYYYLYKLACRVAAKRMNPTFMNIDCDFNKEFYDQGIIPSTMG